MGTVGGRNRARAHIAMICEGLFKTLLWVANFVLFAAGALLIGAGIYVYFDMHDYLKFLDERYANGAVILVVGGVILFVLGFLGCCGAAKGNSCMLKTFAALLAVIVIAEVAGAIYVLAVNPGGSQEIIKDKMEEAMKNYREEGFEGVTIAWNAAQYNLKCCGVDESEDWEKNSGTFKTIPDSCYKDAECEEDYSKCTKKSSTDYYEDGCLTKIEDFVKSNTNLVGGIAIGIALFQILGVIIAWKIPKDA